MIRFALIALVSVEATKLTQQGVDKDDLMQNQASHWRKRWPQGDTDDGDDDDLVLNMKGKGRKYKDPPDVYTYPWRLDDDIVDSQKHLEDTQGLLK